MNTIYVPTDHPAWNAIDDDDWNGHTFVNWLRLVKGKSVVIYPPKGYRTEQLGRFLTSLFNAGAERIVDGWADQPNPKNFCNQCLPLGQELDEDLKDVRDTLKRLADAAEAMSRTEPDKPGNEEVMDEFESVLDEARQLLREAT